MAAADLSRKYGDSTEGKKVFKSAAAADSSGDADKDTDVPLGMTDEEEETKQNFK